MSLAVTPQRRLLFGPAAALLFLVTVFGLALMLPGYSHVHQTISEIGAMDSPTRVPFMLALFGLAVCILVFASGVSRISRDAGHGTWTAWCIGYMAIPVLGIAVFATPHPLHNVFGLSEIVGYQAPAVLALTWRRDQRAKGIVAISWIAFALVWVCMGLNMAGLAPDSRLWAMVRPVIGIAQRALFASWFGWLVAAGLLLRRLAPSVKPPARLP